MAKKLSILDKTFQLALLLHRRTAEFNRKYKFTIGDRTTLWQRKRRK